MLDHSDFPGSYQPNPPIPVPLLAQMQVANDIVQELVMLASGSPEQGWEEVSERPVQIAKALAQQLVERLQAGSVKVWRYDPADGSYFALAEAGIKDPSNVNHIYPDDTPLGEIVRRGDPIMSNDLLNEPWLLAPQWVKDEGLQSLATYPIRLGDEILGALSVFSHHNVGPEFFEVLRFISSYTATAWVNARQTSQLYFQAQRDGLIRKVSQQLRQSLDRQTMQQILVEQVGRFLDVDSCAVLRIPGLDWAQGSIAGIDGENIPDIQVLANYGAPSLDDGLIPDYQALLHQPEVLEQVRREQAWVRKGVLLVPLVLQQHYQQEVMGFLALARSQPFSESVVELVQSVATQAALALHNAHLYEKTRQQGEREALLNQITTTLHQSLNWDEIVQATIDHLCSTLALSRCCFLSVDPTRIQVTYEARDVDLDPLADEYALSEIDQSIVESLYQGQVVELNQWVPYSCVMLGELHIKAGVLIPVHSDRGSDQWASTRPETVLGPSTLIGLVGAFKSEPYAWQPEELELMQSAAHQLAVALTRARLFDHVRQQAERLTLLNSITGAIRSSLDPATLFHAITQQIGEAFEADVCMLTLWHPETSCLRPVGIHAPHLSPQALEAMIPGLTLLTFDQQRDVDWGSQLISPQPPTFLPDHLQERLRKGARLLLGQRMPVVVADTWDPRSLARDPDTLDVLAPAAPGQPEILLVPLWQGEELLGGISLKRIRDTSRRWQPEDVDLALAVAEQAAIAIAQARLLTQTQHQAHRETLLRQIAQQFTLTYDPTRIIDMALAGMSQALGGERCVFLARGSAAEPELGSPTSALQVQQAYPPIEPGIPAISPALNWLISVECYGRCDSLRVEDIRIAPLPPQVRSQLSQEAIQGLLCAPLKPGDEPVAGVLCMLGSQPRSFSEADVDLVQALVDMTAMALQRARFYERSRQQDATAAAVRGLTEGREAESRRLAADLHDQTLADLGALARQVRSLAGDGSLSAAAQGTLTAMDLQLRETITELRGIVEDLQPTAMRAFNLGSALRSLVERAAQRSPQPLLTRFDDRSGSALDQLDPVAQSTLFRILQEALNNITKHAQASRVDVIITATGIPQTRSLLAEDPTDYGSLPTLGDQDPGHLVVRIIDDGIGLQVSPEEHQPEPSSGHGLANMRYRSDLIGASIEWRGRRQGSGTVVELRIPLAPQSRIPAQA